MLLDWLLPDASHETQLDGWTRAGYRPRHGKPPVAIRGVQSAAIVLGRARQRYLGAADEDGVSGVLLAEPPRGPRIDLPHSG